MSIFRTVTAQVVTGILVVGLTLGCCCPGGTTINTEDLTPADIDGDVDAATDDVMEDAADVVEDTAEEATDAVEDAAEEVTDAVQDAVEPADGDPTE